MITFDCSLERVLPLVQFERLAVLHSGIHCHASTQKARERGAQEAKSQRMLVSQLPRTIEELALTLLGLVKIERSNAEKRDLNARFARKQEKPVITVSV